MLKRLIKGVPKVLQGGNIASTLKVPPKLTKNSVEDIITTPIAVTKIHNIIHKQKKKIYKHIFLFTYEINLLK